MSDDDKATTLAVAIGLAGVVILHYLSTAIAALVSVIVAAMAVV